MEEADRRTVELSARLRPSSNRDAYGERPTVSVLYMVRGPQSVKGESERHVVWRVDQRAVLPAPHDDVADIAACGTLDVASHPEFGPSLAERKKLHGES
jgi:hypothetical protein